MPRPRGSRSTLVGALLFGVLLVLLPGPLAVPASAADRPALACLPNIRQISTTDADRAIGLAERKFGAVVQGSPRRYPFGALRAESKYVTRDARKWSSGFFPASLWRLYEDTGDMRWLTAARAYTAGLLPVADFTGSHDLGFMVGLPAGLGARLDPDPANRRTYESAVTTAARTLAKRWNPKVGALHSADYNGQWGVIVDSAMNAPLLIEVGQRIGGEEGRRLERVGTEHMRTLARTFVRPDGSTYHRMSFDPQTGAVLGPVPGQGLDAATSTWARGQAWAINGFARAFELTGDPELGQAARSTAAFWTDRVPAGCIPSWDFDVTNPRSPLDSSAAAIAADGLLRLAALEQDQIMADNARTTLATLTAPWLLTTYSVNPGLLLQQSVNVPDDAREGSYVWGDYYLLAAIRAAR